MYYYVLVRHSIRCCENGSNNLKLTGLDGYEMVLSH